ncbi:MAG: histidine kinase [Xanthomonadales bacterium]|nr:hypothetical protein [Xanthomonadales bacterium]MCC6591688.1 histidine kinase [Xanthomonadales bacterium]MCE7931279.1 sensor histidine kinase [Xanthomonadales bacterium PRO6]
MLRWRLPPTQAWLPPFCQPATVYSAMLLAQIVVLVAVFAPGARDGDWWRALSTGTVLAQWIALASIAVLCLLRTRLLTLPSGLALLAVLLVLAGASAGMAWLAYTLDRELEWGLMSAGQSRAHFMHGVLAIALVMGALGLRYAYVQMQWRRQVEAQARVEVEALTARIRPHFLFNSMNTIAGLVQVDPELAERVTLDLADLFRAALAAGERVHPLQREFELCRRYLDIESLRLGERLRVEWDIDAAPTGLPVPPLLLQPLVENAVYHGIQPLPQGGTVRISAALEDGRLRIDIVNPLAPAGEARRGHGLAQDNVRQRLRYAWGGGASLEVRECDGYYGVTVRLPFSGSREHGHEGSDRR